MRRWVAGLLLVGCEGSLVTSADDFGPFVVLSGRLDPSLVDDPTVDPDAFRGGVAWLVVSDDRLGLQWQPTALEPRLFGYAMDVTGPPDLEDVLDAGPAPPELRIGRARLALGLPVLHVGSAPALDAEALLLWALGTLPDPGSIFGPDSTARGAATGHVLGVLRVGPDVATLAEQPGFVDALPWCRWSELAPGLALYRDDGPSCDGWRSIAYAQEYQGIDMEDLGAGGPDLRK